MVYSVTLIDGIDSRTARAKRRVWNVGLVRDAQVCRIKQLVSMKAIHLYNKTTTD